MVIDINQLKKQGKTECEFCFVIPKEEDFLSIPSTSFDGEITYVGKIEVCDNDVYVDGEISYTIQGECSRCLAPSKMTVIYPVNIRYVTNNPEDGDYMYKSGLVDLQESAREGVILSMPYAIHCKEDCKGLCPKCGANLNETECTCDK